MGGGAGHMRHPFDLFKIKNGSDLLNFFYNIKNDIQSDRQKSYNLKSDGTNVLLKVSGNQLVVDRGSMKPEDVNGMTLTDAAERYPEGHGLRDATLICTSILNKAFPKIQNELKSLGLLDNNFYCINVEYVPAGKMNATDYEKNYLFVHGVNAYYEKSYRGVERPGLERPLVYDPKKQKHVPTKDKSVELPYDKNALFSLINKLNNVAKDLSFGDLGNFEVVGPVDVMHLDEREIQYTSLKKPFSINFSERFLRKNEEIRHLQGSSLKTWLLHVKNKPAQYHSGNYDVFFETSDRKKINPYHKKTYTETVIDKTRFLDEIVIDQDIRSFIDGMDLIHATKELGQDFLNGLTTKDFGHIVYSDDGQHEGVVIRDKSYSDFPFKITGDFIVDGQYGRLAAKMAEKKVTLEVAANAKILLQTLKNHF